MDQRIKKAKRFVEMSDRPLVLWSGMWWDTNNRLVKVRETRLNILHKDAEGQIRFRRLPPQVEVSDTYPYKHRVSFTGDLCCRVQNGIRTGSVVPFSEIENGEKYVPAGIDKVLAEGKSSKMLSKHRKGDQNILCMLETVEDAIPTLCMESVCPTLYLTMPKNRGKLYLRNTGNALSYLLRTQDYDPRETPNQNLRRLQMKLSMDAGNDRKAYPFEHVTGHGVLAASAMSPSMSFGTWYSVPDVTMDTEHLRIAI